MTPRVLLEKIEQLPPEEQAEVEDFVEFVRLRHARRQSRPATSKTFSDDLLRAINEEREELKRTQGLFDTLPIIHEFRDTGGR